MLKTRGQLLCYVKVFVVVTSVFLAGYCFAAPMRAYTGPERPASETALIEGATMGINIVSCDGTKVTSLSVSVLPGDHTIEMSYGESMGYSSSNALLKFTAEAGHTYALDRKTGTVPGRYYVAIIDRTTGKSVSSTSVVTQAVAEQRLSSAEKSIKQFPQNGNFWGEKGEALFNLKRYEEALPALETALSFLPNSAYGWSIKSKTLYELKRYDEALTAIDTAIQFRPDLSEYKRVKETIIKARGDSNPEGAKK